MHIIHMGDLHFDEAAGRLDASDGINHGWHDVARAFDQAVDAAIAAHDPQGLPAVIWFGGDLSLHRRPSPQTYRHVAAGIARAHRAGVPTLAAPGNHDIANPGMANALDPLREVPGFHLFNEPAIAYLHQEHDTGSTMVSTQPIEGADAAIVTVPWIPRATVAARLPDDANLNDLPAAMGRDITAVIRGLVLEAREAAGDETPIMVAWHGSVTGATTGTGRRAELFGEPLVSAHDLQAMPISGVMLNHIHRAQRLGSTDPGEPPLRAGAAPVVYSGSIERLTFGDEDTTPGWVKWTLPSIVDGDTIDALAEHYPTPNARRFLTIRDDTVWSAESVRTAIVRVQLEEPHAGSPAELPDVDEAGWRKRLMDLGAHNVTEVSLPDGKLEVMHAAADIARHEPIDALRTYLEAEHPDAEADWIEQVLADARVIMGRDVDEHVMYGGAAGGGKSATLREAAEAAIAEGKTITGAGVPDQVHALQLATTEA